jgi:hypothetical protein
MTVGQQGICRKVILDVGEVVQAIDGGRQGPSATDTVTCRRG